MTSNNGGDRRAQAARALEQLGIFSVLSAYHPVLAGTIPLGVDLPESDLDLLCQAGDLDVFIRDVEAAYGRLPEFQANRLLIRGRSTALIQFRAEGFAFELFAQDRPPELQEGYRHMVLEARLLELAGESGRDRVRRLRAAGWKTEPAFAHWLGLEGDDPYQALLGLENWTEQELRDRIAARETSEAGKTSDSDGSALNPA